MKINIFEGSRRIGYIIMTFLFGFAFYDAFYNRQAFTFSGLMSAFSVPLFFYLFMVAVGWIVRGFLGIAKGKDFKE